jgi:hypothetical protein
VLGGGEGKAGKATKDDGVGEGVDEIGDDESKANGEILRIAGAVPHFPKQQVIEFAMRSMGVDHGVDQGTNEFGKCRCGVCQKCLCDDAMDFVDAAVAFEVLTSGKYAGSSLALTGPEALSFAQVTEKIGAVIGKPLRFQCISDDEAAWRFSATGASAEETQAHVELWRAIREGRLGTVVDGVRSVLGRRPIAFDQWVTENAAAFC